MLGLESVSLSVYVYICVCIRACVFTASISMCAHARIHVQGEIYLKMRGALGFHTAVMHLRAAYSLASRVHAVSMWWVVV